MKEHKKGRSYAEKKEHGSKVRGTDNRKGRKRNAQKWEFIGVDGEGSTHPETGRSIYQILTAYGVDDKACKTIEDKSGLETIRCFEFLLSLRYRQSKLAICGYGFTYDICNMLTDVPWKKLQNLAADRATYLYGDIKTRYKVRVIYKKLLEIWKLRRHNGKWSAKFEHGGGYVRVYDVIGFFQCSFEKAITDWKIPEKGELAIIAEYKKRRGEPIQNDWQGWKRYNTLECELLVRLMESFAATLEAEDIHISSWWGAGSIASYWYTKNNVKSHIIQDFGPEINRDIMYAYFGGQVQTFYRGRINQKVYHYDICSAYPWATAQLPSLVGKWEEVSDFIPGKKWALYQVEYDFRSVWERTRYGPFPWRAKHQQIFYPRRGRGIFWAHEVEVVRRFWGECIKVIRGRTFTPLSDEFPFDWVPGLFDRRNALKLAGDPRNIPLKLGLNSLYGKTAQGIGMKDSRGNLIIPKYQSYFWAGNITAMTRARMIEANALNPGKLLNVSTDGLFSLDALTLPFRGKGLGNWDEEEPLEWFELYGNGIYRGFYIDANGKERYLTRTRGTEDRNFPFDRFAEEFRKDGLRAKLEIIRHRFRGYKIAAHRNSPEQFCTWADEPATIQALGLLPYHALETEHPQFYRMECSARSSEALGKYGPDLSFPEPYIPRLSPLEIAPPFHAEELAESIAMTEQP